MRITSQLLRKLVHGPIEQTQYLDLSGRKIAVIEHLEECPKLHTLILQDNVIDTINNIEWNRELWNIDLSGNRVKCLHGLSRFPALGSLILSDNSLDWQELKRISHIHLLSLTLTGNLKLVNDPHYRCHVIDLFPHLWMLDGQLITAGERKEVQQFFTNSATTSHPVRHKNNTHSVFVPTNLQNLLVTGVFGEKVRNGDHQFTTQLMAKFPLKYTHNIDLDKRRLIHLANVLEDDLKIENEYRIKQGREPFSIPPLQRLMEQRSLELEQCNMLLLIVVIYLEFELPYELIVATLDTAKLTQIGDVLCKDLFALPCHVLLRIASLLLSGATIDRDEQNEGGLYPLLYQSLQFLVCSLHRTISCLSSTTGNGHDIHSSYDMSTSSLTVSSTTITTLKSPSHSTQCLCLLASEIVHLMCLVPVFFDYLDSNTGVLEMVAVATKNRKIGDVISQIAWKIQNNGGDMWDLYHEIASYLLQATTANIFTKRRHNFAPRLPKSPSRRIPHTSSQILQPSKKSSPHAPPRALSAGAPHRRRHMTPTQPDLGDLVLCAPERLARIVALPEPHVAVLQLSSGGKGFTGPPDSYFYTDPRGLVWDRKHNHWTKDDLASDLSVGRLHPSPEHSRAAHQRSPSPDSTHSLNVGYTRPHSQMSYFSEDLQTIPSVEELSLDDDIVLREEDDGEAPMKVDINHKQGSPIRTLLQRPKTPEQIEEAKQQHQLHVIEQYSHQKSAQLHPPNDEQSDHLIKGQEDITGIPQSPREHWTSKENDAEDLTEQNSLANLVIPTPKLSFPRTWESSKSLPRSLFSSSPARPHSCQPPSKMGVASLSKSPPTVQSSSSSTSLLPFQKTKPVVIHAWSPVKSGVQPKQTRLSSARTAERSSKPSFHSSSRPQSRQGTSLILHSRTSPSPVPTSSSPLHMAAYSSYVRKQQNKHQVQRLKSGNISKGHGPRKLGDVQGLSVLGTSPW